MLPDDELAAVEGAELADGGCAEESPAHAGTTQASIDDTLAGGLDFAGIDFPAVGDVRRIIHAMLIVADLVGQQSVRFELSRAATGLVESLQFGTAGQLVALGNL